MGGGRAEVKDERRRGKKSEIRVCRRREGGGLCVGGRVSGGSGRSLRKKSSMSVWERSFGDGEGDGGSSLGDLEASRRALKNAYFAFKLVSLPLLNE